MDARRVKGLGVRARGLLVALLAFGLGMPVVEPSARGESLPASELGRAELDGLVVAPVKRLPTGTAGTPAPRPAAPHDNPPGTPSKAQVAETAAKLGVPVEVVQKAVEGLGFIYARRYDQARTHFQAMVEDHPEHAAGPFGLVLLYQARMMENFDYAYEGEWQAASEETLKRAEKALKRDQAPAWNHFIRGGALGVESIYLLRKAQYVPALNLGVKALSSMEKAHELEPSFHDPALGVGLYNYWRSVLTQKLWYLPFFKDKKELGMAQVLQARDQGIFTGPGARLALAYSFLHEHKVDLAKQECQELARLYPDNLINNTMLGRIALRQGRVKEAKRHFAKVRRTDPTNWLVEYYDGLVAMREKRYMDARGHFLAYLSHDGDLGGQAFAHYRLGDVYWQLNLDGQARASWEKSLALNGDLQGPKRRLAGKTPPRKGTVEIYVRPASGASSSGAPSSGAPSSGAPSGTSAAPVSAPPTPDAHEQPEEGEL